MNKSYYVSVTAVVLVSGYLVFALTTSLGPGGRTDQMSMPGMNAVDTKTSDATKEFQSTMNAMMEGMMKPVTGYPDVDFANGMIPHHEGAIAMAKTEKKFGKDLFLLEMAENIIKAQEGEIATLRAWLAKQSSESITQSVPEASKASYEAMMAMMKSMAVSYTGNTDVDFANGMIPHHQGAIEMAKIVLQFGKDADMRNLANSVMTDPQAEISALQGWLAKAKT